MAASKFQIVRKCQVCGEEFMAKTIESLVLFAQMLQNSMEA